METTKDQDIFDKMKVSSRVPSFCMDTIRVKQNNTNIPNCASCGVALPTGTTYVSRKREFVGEPNVLVKYLTLCYECWKKV